MSRVTTQVNRNLPTIAFNKMNPLSDDELAHAVPAVFSKHAVKEVSPRYGFISSAEITGALREAGFVPVEARSYHRRANDARQFAKHMIKFRPAGSLEKLTKLNEVVPQVVMVNSHDRSSRFDLYGGMFRLVCLNGLLVSTGSTVEPVRLRHTVNMVDEAMYQAASLIEQTGEIVEVVGAMKEHRMTREAQEAFARAAFAQGRFGGEERVAGLDVASILVPRRESDAGDDLWSVFNRVQENVTHGGGIMATATGRRLALPPIAAIDGDIKFNTTAWMLAMEVIGRAALSSAKEAGQLADVTADDLV